MTASDQAHLTFTTLENELAPIQSALDTAQRNKDKACKPVAIQAPVMLMENFGLPDLRLHSAVFRFAEEKESTEKMSESGRIIISTSEGNAESSNFKVGDTVVLALLIVNGGNAQTTQSSQIKISATITKNDAPISSGDFNALITDSIDSERAKWIISNNKITFEEGVYCIKNLVIDYPSDESNKENNNIANAGCITISSKPVQYSLVQGIKRGFVSTTIPQGRLSFSLNSYDDSNTELLSVIKKKECTGNDFITCDLTATLEKDKKYSILASMSEKWGIKKILVVSPQGETIKDQDCQSKTSCTIEKEEFAISTTQEYTLLVLAEPNSVAEPNSETTSATSSITGSVVSKITGLFVKISGFTFTSTQKKAPTKEQAGLGAVGAQSPIGSTLPQSTSPSTSSPTFPNCWNKICDPEETCTYCPSDCGQCVYGVGGRNPDSVCGWVNRKMKDKLTGITLYKDKKLITKPGNLDISVTTAIKAAVDKWVFSDAKAYHTLINNKYDAAVVEIGRQIERLYNRDGSEYEKFGVSFLETPCPYKGFAPESPSNLLYGLPGSCVDWSGLTLSLLRTANIPRERTFQLCYGANPFGHCVAIYKSDSGENWIIDYGEILKSLGDSNVLTCKSEEDSFWATDDKTGWGLNGVSCTSTPTHERHPESQTSLPDLIVPAYGVTIVKYSRDSSGKYVGTKVTPPLYASQDYYLYLYYNIINTGGPISNKLFAYTVYVNGAMEPHYSFSKYIKTHIMPLDPNKFDKKADKLYSLQIGRFPPGHYIIKIQADYSGFLGPVKRVELRDGSLQSNAIRESDEENNELVYEFDVLS